MSAYLTEGTVSGAVRTIALAEGMDPSQPPYRLYEAVCLRHRKERERIQEDALTSYMLSVFLLSHGKDLSYWDVVGHLFPKDVVEERKACLRRSQETAKQMRAVEDMRAAQIVRDEARWEKERREEEKRRRKEGMT